MYLCLFEFSVLAWFCSLAFATLLVVPFFTTVVTRYILGWALRLWMCWPCSATITVLPLHSILVLGSVIFVWNSFETPWFSSTKENLHLSLQDVVVVILRPSRPLLNYLLLIAKLYIWDCRRNQILSNITGFKFKVRLKYEVELYIGSYGKKKDILEINGRAFRISCYKSNNIVSFVSIIRCN